MALEGDERRGRLRYAVVRSQTSFDPLISEWGNPMEVMFHHPFTEYIGLRKLTGGSETSQYPEERKSNETLLVAASEQGIAQTIWFRPGGVVGQSSSDPRLDRGTGWEAWPKRVKASYLKLKVALTVPEYRGTRETPWESGRTIFQG